MKLAANNAKNGSVKFRMQFFLKIVAFFLLAGGCFFVLLLIRHQWFYSGQVLGNLKVSHAPFLVGRNMYELSVDGKVFGRVSELDTWYVENQYAYGTTYAEKRGGGAYFVFNCQTNRYESYSSRGDFRLALEKKGIPWQNFMSGENVIAMKYNRRMFNHECPHASGA